MPEPSLDRLWARCAFFSLALSGLLTAGCTHTLEPADSLEQRIAHYGGVLAEYPERYPLRVSLAQACLEKARQSLDPAWVAKARAELQRSLDTQESFEAFVVCAQLANFAHRFEDALRWTERAIPSSVHGQPTPELQLIRAEALLGLGRTEAVAALIPEADQADERFEWAAVAGRWLAESSRLEEAARAFARAAELAEAVGQNKWAGWASVQEAGCYLDGGNPAAARPVLEHAEMLIPGDAALAIHWAEYHQAHGDWNATLRIYESLLSRTDHPLYHQLAWKAAWQLGLSELARMHYRAAERGYRRVIDAGEVYTLGALARLYAQAGTHLAEAARLAHQNLEHVRDKDARETVAAVDEASLERNAAGNGNRE